MHVPYFQSIFVVLKFVDACLGSFFSDSYQERTCILLYVLYATIYTFFLDTNR